MVRALRGVYYSGSGFSAGQRDVSERAKGFAGERKMLDHTILTSVAEQMMGGREVVVEGRTSRVTRTGAQRLRTVRFTIGGREYQAIEQNPEKPSRWGKLAREGHRVVQVRDLGTQKYVAAVADGKVTEYTR